jgi:hypothetical protein
MTKAAAPLTLQHALRYNRALDRKVAMGSLVQLKRRRSVERSWRKAPVDVASRQSANSLFILIAAFGATAIAMSVAVVVVASKTWKDVLIMSAFVFVIALAKIVLADVLFYVMLRSDATVEAEIAAKAKSGALFRRPPWAPPRPGLKPSPTRRRTGRTVGSTKLASLSSHPRP